MLLMILSPPFDGSQIVHSYGNEQALSAIAGGQSGLFETSFNDVFLVGEISALTLASLLALGGGGGGKSSTKEVEKEVIVEVEKEVIGHPQKPKPPKTSIF